MNLVANALLPNTVPGKDISQTMPITARYALVYLRIY